MILRVPMLVEIDYCYQTLVLPTLDTSYQQVPSKMNDINRNYTK